MCPFTVEYSWGYTMPYKEHYSYTWTKGYGSDRLNSNEAQIPIDYACGWAISTDEGTYTLQMLLDKADSDMYENKQLCKKRNLGSRQ